MSKKNEAPKLVDKTETEIAHIIEQINASDWSASTKSFLIGCIESAVWLPKILRKQKINIFRLRELVFGQGWSNRRKKKQGSDNGDTSDDKNETDTVNNKITSSHSNAEDNSNRNTDKGETVNVNSASMLPPRKGNGCNSHTVYQNYDEQWVLVNGLSPKDLCPLGCGGRLYVPTNTNPGVVVRVTGQDFMRVKKYYLQALRCNLCGYYIKATLPKEAGEEKYDERFRAILALYKFELGVPYQRLERYQGFMKNPLPDSTQWDEIQKLGGYAYSIFEVLQYLTANGAFIHNDDTYVKILSVIADLQKIDNPTRTGMFTTGIVGQHQSHPIALFFNGTLHAGENLNNVLKKRDKTLSPIIQMCDALSRNIPVDIPTLVCNCLSHGFRKFKDIRAFFPEICQSIMHQLADVFAIDAKTKTMDDDARLAYHQKHSAPIMHAVYDELCSYLNDKVIEPNDDCGLAIAYMQKHWVRLTQFLKTPGAPIDNLVVERTLKMAIKVRKNSLFYRTVYSASLSGMLTSLIETCKLNAVNPIEYLVAIQQHYDAVKQNPKAWLPWNYQTALAALTTEVPANPDPVLQVNPVAITPATVRPESSQQD